MLVTLSQNVLCIIVKQTYEELYKLSDKDEWILKDSSSRTKWELNKSKEIKVTVLLAWESWSNNNENGNRIPKKIEWWSWETNLPISYGH